MKHIFIFGASTVHGVGGERGGWADRTKTTLYTQMFQRGGERWCEVYELGIPGTTLQDTQARLETELAARAPAARPSDIFIVFSAGANDAAATNDVGHYLYNSDDFAAQVHSFVHLAKDYTKDIVAVGVTPVDETKANPLKGSKAHYKNQRLIEFEDALQSVCDSEGITVVPLMRAVPADWSQHCMHRDGLHPNDAGYDWIFDYVYPKLLERVRRT